MRCLLVDDLEKGVTGAGLCGEVGGPVEVQSVLEERVALVERGEGDPDEGRAVASRALRLPSATVTATAH